MAKKEEFKPKLIDGANLKKSDIKDITDEMLAGDAIARKNKEAYEFVKEKSQETIKRKARGGEGQEEVKRPITKYRLEYLVKYTGYVVETESDEEKRARKKAEAKKAREDFFAKADKYFE